jgi:ribosomal protein S18 acetylase RimI-like enzyme
MNAKSSTTWPSLAIRKATPADRPALQDLLVRSWMTTWAPACPPEAVERFRKEDPVGRYLDACLERIDLGLVDERIAAAMQLEEEHLAALHVAPDLKGCGIGSAMMAEAERRGARRLEVRAFNAPAIRFYERRGWQRAATYEGTEMGVPMPTHEYRRPL